MGLEKRSQTTTVDVRLFGTSMIIAIVVVVVDNDGYTHLATYLKRTPRDSSSATAAVL